MKLEVAPWEKSSSVNIDQLFTEVTLEKLTNEPYGLKREELAHHRNLFKMPQMEIEESEPKNEKRQQCSSRCYPFRLCKRSLFCSGCFQNCRRNDENGNRESKADGQKVLLIGKTGRGKTSVGKKLANDWTTGAFNTFSIVFLLLLKAVQPGDSIETTIKNQVPDLNDFSNMEQSLKNLLDTFGDKCLLILDGFDEYIGRHSDRIIEQTDEIFKLLKNRKYNHCNILVTSRPHCITAIEEHFETFNIKGFTEGQAEVFASKILGGDQSENSTDVKNVIALDYFYECPLLLSIMCSLVNNNNIVLVGDRTAPGEIFYHVILCLCKYYLRRKGLDNIDISRCVPTLKKLGVMALKMRLSVTYFPRKSQVIREIGEDAFDLGLMVGIEGYFHQGKNMSADISPVIFATVKSNSSLRLLVLFRCLSMEMMLKTFFEVRKQSRQI